LSTPANTTQPQNSSQTRLNNTAAQLNSIPHKTTTSRHHYTQEEAIFLLFLEIDIQIDGGGPASPTRTIYGSLATGNFSKDDRPTAMQMHAMAGSVDLSSDRSNRTAPLR